jgi:formate dehydrogenase subunit gamma
MPPATAAAQATSGAGLRALIAPLADETGGPVTALRAIQDERGWIESEALDVVADVFNLSRAEVRGLVAFYADFRTTPPADHAVVICQAEACQAAGSRALTKELEERLGVTLGRTSGDGAVGLEAVYCLGLCARAPALSIDGRLVVDADGAVDRVVEQVRR